MFLIGKHGTQFSLEHHTFYPIRCTQHIGRSLTRNREPRIFLFYQQVWIRTRGECVTTTNQMLGSIYLSLSKNVKS